MYYYKIQWTCAAITETDQEMIKYLILLLLFATTLASEDKTLGLSMTLYATVIIIILPLPLQLHQKVEKLSEAAEEEDWLQSDVKFFAMMYKLTSGDARLLNEANTHTGPHHC